MNTSLVTIHYRKILLLKRSNDLQQGNLLPKFFQDFRHASNNPSTKVHIVTANLCQSSLEQAKTWQAQSYRDETQNLLADFFLGCSFLWHIKFQESCWWGDLNPPCFLVHKRYNLLHKWNPDLNISTAIYCRGKAHS